jgi:hypothetical protein
MRRKTINKWNKIVSGAALVTPTPLDEHTTVSITQDTLGGFTDSLSGAMTLKSSILQPEPLKTTSGRM